MNNIKETISGSFLCEFLTTKQIPESVRLVCDTFNLKHEVVSDFFQKRIIQNPYQNKIKNSGVGIWKDKRLVAFMGMFGQPWWIQGQNTVIGFAAYICVNPEYRGNGFGTKLINKSKECAVITGCTSLGVNTRPMYSKNGFHSIGKENDYFRDRVSYRLSLAKRLGSFAGYLLGSFWDLFLKPKGKDRKLMDSFNFSLVRRCDESFDELWERAKGGYVSCLERSSEYLNWRLFDSPTCPLQLAGIYDSGGLLRSFGVWHTITFDQNIRTAVLRDLFSAIDDDEAIKALLLHLLVHWRNMGISWVNFEVVHPRITQIFQTLGFEYVPWEGNRYHIHADCELNDNTWIGWFRSGLDGDYMDLKSPSEYRYENF